MVGIADAGAPPAHLSPLPRHRGEALTRTASCPRPRPLRRTEGAHIGRYRGYRPGTRRADCSTGAPTRDVPGHIAGQGWSDRPAPATRLRCRRALAEAMLLRGAGGGEKDRSVANGCYWENSISDINFLFHYLNLTYHLILIDKLPETIRFHICKMK